MRFTCCQMIDSSLKKIIFTYFSQEQTLSRLHYLLPNIYSSMKKILKNCWKKDSLFKILEAWLLYMYH